MALDDALIYFPSRFPQGDWSPRGLAFEDVWFSAVDGTRLHGWFVPHSAPRAFLLYSHGNAGNLSTRAPVLRLLNERLRLAILIYDYRGYGKSDGRPSEAGVLADARAARDWLAARSGAPVRNLVLFGRSLGGAVAVDLAVETGAAALILESTFTTMQDVAAAHYPLVLVRLVLRTQFDSLVKIGRYHGPLLMSHGQADDVVPYALGRRLFDAANEPKRFVTFPGANHNDPPPADYYETMDAFLNEHVDGRRAVSA
jgi:fermentation-respiration switch protein FrsA (DUF1100 family)